MFPKTTNSFIDSLCIYAALTVYQILVAQINTLTLDLLGPEFCLFEIPRKLFQYLLFFFIRDSNFQTLFYLFPLVDSVILSFINLADEAGVIPLLYLLSTKLETGEKVEV